MNSWSWKQAGMGGCGRRVQKDNGKRRQWQKGEEALCPMSTSSFPPRPKIKSVNKHGSSCSILNDGDLRLFVFFLPFILFCMMALLTRYKWGDTCTPSTAWLMTRFKDNFQVLVLYILCSSITCTKCNYPGKDTPSFSYKGRNGMLEENGVDVVGADGGRQKASQRKERDTG